MAMPRVLTNFNFYIDGQGWAGRADSITLPNLVKTMEDHRAGGMDIAKSIRTGMEKLVTSMVTADWDAQLIKQLALDDLPLTARGSVKRQGEVTAQAVVINMRGQWSGIEFGQWALGGKVTNTITADLHYFRLRQNGEELVEIDVENMICRFGGVDILASERAAIGL